MSVTKKSLASYPHYLEVGPYKFQVVHSFTYVGLDVNCDQYRNSGTYPSCKQVFFMD